MKTDQKLALAVVNGVRFRQWMVFGIAVAAFMAGSLLTADVMHRNQVRAESDRVFELNIYHTLPGKAPELEALFKGDSKLMAKHGLNVVGFFVPNEDPAWADRFIYLVAHSSRDEAKKNWKALTTDPESRVYIEAAKPLIEKVDNRFNVDEVYMRPTEFSPMK